MNRIITAVATAAMLLAMAGCAKEKSETTNEASKRYFDAWIHVHYPDVEKTGLGIYIIDEAINEDADTRKDFTDAPYLYVNYTISNLEGTVSSTNDIGLAQQLGNYNASYYYGPAIWVNTVTSLPAGVREMFKGMKIGDRRTAAIPGWLMGYREYDTEEEYLANITDGTDAIYTVEVKDTTNDVYRRQIEEIEQFVYKYTDNSGTEQVWKVEAADTIYHGFYYHEIYAGDEDEDEDSEDSSLSDGTSVDIYYTGSLLNGQVFDTTDEKTAKDNNIYSSSKTYAKVSANWSSDSTAVTLNSNSVVRGFASTLCRMKKYGARGVGVFYSPLGYKESGSGSIIPGYAPLVFEIEIAPKEED